MALFESYAAALAATIVVEAPIARALGGRRAPGASVGLNLVTHPLAALAAGSGAPFALVEAAVVAVEAVGYRVLLPELAWRRAILVAVAANAVTAAMSFL